MIAQAKTKTAPKRYNSVAIILHWVMALAFFTMLGSGLAMTYLEFEDKQFQFKLYQWHKAGGVLLLIAFVLRIGWRLATKVPKLPAKFSDLDKKLAKLGHWGLYFVMFAMPMTGWLMASSSQYGLPTIVFGWFEWPHMHEVIPSLAKIEANESIEGFAKDAHFYLAIAFGLMIAAHIIAVIKHIVKDNENLLPRMWWTKK